MSSLKGSRLYLLDLLLAGGALYGAVWLYEIANYVVGAVVGGGATLTVNGFLPTGVVVYGSVAPFSKLIQTTICVGCVLLGLATLRSTRLWTTKTALISILGLYLASIQWEILPQISGGQIEIHQIVFVSLASAGGLALLWALGGYFNVLGASTGRSTWE